MLIETVMGLGFLFCLAIAFVLYKSNVNFGFKLVTLPLSIAFTLSAIYTLIVLAGAPIPGYPSGMFDYVHHKVINQGAGIALWAKPKALDNYRLYTFPYTREVEKKLYEAQSRAKKSRVQAKFKGEKKQGKKPKQVLELFRSKPTLETDNPVKPQRRIN
jgi:hypothetical protein